MSRSPACSRRAWWCTRPTATAAGQWVQPADVRIEADGGERRAVHVGSGAPVDIGAIEKMSKSKRNVVDPDDIIASYGADTARWFMLSDSPPERGRDLDGRRCSGSVALRPARVAPRQRSGGRHFGLLRPSPNSDAVGRAAHKALAGVQDDIERLHFNTAVARIYTLANAIGVEIAAGRAGACRDAAGDSGAARRTDDAAPRRGMLAGARPARTRGGRPDGLCSILTAILDETIVMPVQVNGKRRAELRVPADADARRDRSRRPGRRSRAPRHGRPPGPESDRRAEEDRQCRGLIAGRPSARTFARAGIVATALLGLSACLRPQYGPTASGMPLRDALASIAVDMPQSNNGQERLGHFVRSELIFDLDGSGEEHPKKLPPVALHVRDDPGHDGRHQSRTRQRRRPQRRHILQADLARRHQDAARRNGARHRDLLSRRAALRERPRRT